MTDREPIQLPLNSRQRILVVDHDSDLRRLNAQVLTSSGYRVDVAANGIAAWEAIQLNHYDLLVTDYKMPKVSGVELLQKLYDAQTVLPIIIISATIPGEKLERPPWLRVDAILSKPYEIDELVETVKAVLHAATSAREEITPPPNWQSFRLPSSWHS